MIFTVPLSLTTHNLYDTLNVNILNWPYLIQLTVNSYCTSKLTCHFDPNYTPQVLLSIITQHQSCDLYYSNFWFYLLGVITSVSNYWLYLFGIFTSVSSCFLHCISLLTLLKSFNTKLYCPRTLLGKSPYFYPYKLFYTCSEQVLYKLFEIIPYNYPNRVYCRHSEYRYCV